MDVKCKHLLQLMSKLFINNDLAVRIFFVVAFNKLLFPAVDTNVRGKDAFMTMDVSDFPIFNWCKVVVDEIHYAAITWWSEKKEVNPWMFTFLYSKFIFTFVSFHATYSLCLFDADILFG
jgi:hypothetical protein